MRPASYDRDMGAHDSHWLSLSRRSFLVTGAAAIARLRAMPATPACTLAPEQEEGPYYVDNQIVRPDITEGKTGLPLKLRVALVDSHRCGPLSGAALDIWHCDALGVDSAFAVGAPGGSGRGPGPGRGGPPPGPPADLADGFRPDGPPPFGVGRGPGGARPSDAARFLRGVQLADSQGIVEFTTLYPGWYEGRTIHIHVKVHLGGNVAEGKYAGGHVSHIGQLFLPEEASEEVSRLQPYAQRLNVYRTLQSEDGVFTGQHGAASIVMLARVGPRRKEEGFVATVTLGIDPEAIPARVSPGGPGGRRGGRA
jgi:protocatechuate 3,4-dioxygenase beta subunit